MLYVLSGLSVGGYVAAAGIVILGISFVTTSWWGGLLQDTGELHAA